MLTKEERVRRQGCLTASSVAAVLGCSKWGSPYSVFMNKTQPLEEDTPSAAQLRGHLFEPGLMEHFISKVTIDDAKLVQPDVASLPLTLEDWRGCTPDGVLELDDEVILIDAKTQRDKTGWGHGNLNLEELSPTSNTKVPLDYECQMRWSMPIVEAHYGKPCRKAVLVVYFLLQDEFAFFIIDRDKEVEETMVEKCRSWWWRHIIAGVAPEIDGSHQADTYLKKTYTTHGVEMIERPELEASAHSLKKLKEDINEMTKQKKSLENQLKQAIGSDKGVYGTNYKATWTERKGRETLDIKRLQLEQPETYTQFLKAGAPYRVLKVS